MTFVLVDRNAIAQNDRTGGDQPVIVVHPEIREATPCKALEIVDRDGRVVGRFLSQSRSRKVNPSRPHVWFELDEGCTARAIS